MEKVFTVRQASKTFGIPESLLRRMIASGALKGIRCGCRVYLREGQIDAAFAAAEASGQDVKEVAV